MRNSFKNGILIIESGVNMNDKKNILIVILLIAVVALSFGVVSYSNKDIQTDNVNGVKEWDVAITNVEIVKEGEAIDGNTKYSEGTLVVNPILNGIYDSVTYKVTIENNGLLDAKLNKSLYDKEDSILKYDIEEPKKTLKSGEKIEITIKAYLDSKKYQGENNVTNKLTAMYEYIQVT